MAINRNLDLSSYTDFQGLARLKNTANKDPRAAVKSVAQQFETQFIQMMMKSMRDATPKDPLFGGQQMKMFQSMFDKEIAQKMAGHGGIGLASVIEKQLTRHVGGQGMGPALDKRIEPGPKTYPLGASAPSLPLGQGARNFPLPDRDPTLRPLAFRSAESTQGDPASAGSETTTAANLPGASQSPAYWSSPDAFVADILPHAKAAAKKLGVPASVLVAQSALETGWGKHVPRDAEGRPNFNFFGIKADASWNGPRQNSSTLEFNGHAMVRSQASFRAYHQVSDSFDDLVHFLQSNPRYRQALAAKDNPEAFARALQRAGYATDPQYADKLIAILRSGRIPTAQADAAANSANQSG